MIGKLMLENIRNYLTEVSDLVMKVPADEVDRVTRIIIDAYHNRNTIFVFGNGGGSATASHFVCDLSKGTVTPGAPRLKALSLTNNVALITAWANDTDYTNTFGEQLENLVAEGDVVIGLSGSGMSPNVINAFHVANRAKATSILFSGFDGGKAMQVAAESIVVPSDDMQQIEDVHMILTHVIFRCVRDQITG